MSEVDGRLSARQEPIGPRWKRMGKAKKAAIYIGVGILALGVLGSRTDDQKDDPPEPAARPTSVVTSVVTTTVDAPPVTVTASPITVTAPPVTVTAAGAAGGGGATVPSQSEGRRGLADSPAYYPNCTAVRAAGKAPIRVGQPGYGRHLDRDDDGIGCE